MELNAPMLATLRSELTGIRFIDHDSGRHQNKPVEIEINEQGCYNVISHKPNQDGYIRKCFLVNGKKRLIMYHRHKWITTNGPIPEGYEVDHMCRNRKCCNPEHLQILTVSEHKSKTNRERYAERIEGIKFAISEGFSANAIAKAFGVTYHTVRRYANN